MKKEDRNFDIKRFLKKDRNIVIELDDEVEYIVDDNAVAAIEKGEEIVKLIRVVDRTIQPISLRRIVWAFLDQGAIDYLDKKKIEELKKKVV